MERIIVVRDLDEYEGFRSTRRGDWRDFQVYTLRPSTCLGLREAGIPARILSEHIPAADAEDIYRKAFGDATRVVEAASAAQGAGGVQLARLFKIYYWEFLVDAYALDAVLSRWNRERRGAPICHIRRIATPPSAHTQLADPLPLSEHMFRGSMRRGEAEPLQVFSLWRTDLRRAVSAQLGGACRNGLGPILRRIRRTRGESLEMPAGRRAIGWGSSYDALIVMPDTIRVAGEAGLRPLLVTEGVDGDTHRTGLVYRDAYDAVERFSVARYLAGRPGFNLSSEERRQAERAYKSLLEAVDATEVGSKYQLSFLLRGLRSEFTNGLLVARQMDHLLGRWAGSAVILTHFNGLQERIIEQLAPRHHIQVYARPHGWLANPETYEFEAAHYVVPGQLQAQFVRRFFGYGEQVAVEPDPNLTRVAEEWRRKGEGERQALAAQRRGSLGIKARYVIAILATMARNRALSEFDYQTFHDCWASILTYLKLHPEVHVVVKAHPKFNYNAWLSALCAREGVQNISILSERLEEVLGWVDLAVDLGYPGTATIVTLLFEKPLLLYRGLYKYVRDFGDIAHAVGKSFTVETPGALLEEWDRLRRDGEMYLRALEVRNRVLSEGLASV